MSFATIPELLEELRAGRMVVIVDDEDRENEGDLIMAASCVRAEDINFMVREARGLVCLALTQQRSDRLGLKPMVDANRSPFHTNFTVSIEAARGVTTGISAQDRATTIQAAVDPDATPADLVQPGHIFPLTAQPGGVLTRAGHTEASCDLAALAGFEPAGVLVEILADDGTMARRPQLEVFAQRHGLKIGSIADLIRYRLATEKTVERVHETDVQTEFGPFRLVVYRDRIKRVLHHAMVRGDITTDAPVLTRVHVRDTLGDVLHVVRDDPGTTLVSALRRVAEAGRGVVVVLDEGDEPAGNLDRLFGRMPAEPDDTTREWRRNGVGAQILGDLGVRKLHVIGTARRLVGLAGFGLHVSSHDHPGKLPP